MIKFESLNRFENVWLTSDIHYSHKNICRGTSSWDLEDHGGESCVRNFDTIEQMNDVLVKGINDNVKSNDCLIILGDIAFSGRSKIDEFCNRLSTYNLVITYGNHDHNIRSNPYYQETYFSNIVAPADMQYLQFRGVRFMCSHYPMIIWHQSHKGVPLAFGHVHGSNPGLGKSQDVGVDVAHKLFGEYRPFQFSEFVDITNKKQVHLESHHNSKTN